MQGEIYGPGILYAKPAQGSIKAIQKMNKLGFNVFIGKQGDLNLLIKFEDVSSIKLFEQKYPQIIESLRKSLVFKESVFVGVCAFTFEQEAALTEK